MLRDAHAYATLPTQDMDRLRRFYEDVLGLRVRSERPAGIFYQTGEGTFFAITRSSGRASGSHTQLGFAVTDLESSVAELRNRGVIFEEYENPKTVNGIARMPAGNAAWFRDPDGNLIGMIEFDDEV
jgi:catechol 2,3-dioxygenase-like lactoylglutathione lyase family enzyme